MGPRFFFFFLGKSERLVKYYEPFGQINCHHFFLLVFFLVSVGKKSIIPPQAAKESIEGIHSLKLIVRL